MLTTTDSNTKFPLVISRSSPCLYDLRHWTDHRDLRIRPLDSDPKPAHSRTPEALPPVDIIRELTQYLLLGDCRRTWVTIMKKFLKICFQILLFSTVDAPIYFPTNSVKGVPFPPDPLQNLLLADFLKMTFLTSLMLYLIVVGGGVVFLIVVLICISLILTDDEHLFMCLLAICMSTLEKCGFMSSVHFTIELLFYLICMFLK